MKLRNRKIYNRRKESGVALLFAIGLLSLMIMLGVSFSMESIQSQKIASNNSNRSATKAIAQSALRHVSTSIMYYVDQQYWDNAKCPVTEKDKVSNKFMTDFSPIVSQDIADAYKTGDGMATNIDVDMLSDLLPFKTPFVTKFDAENNAAHKNYKDYYDRHTPRWIYVYDKNDGAADKAIIGRFAYRILPPASTTQINLAYFLTGNQSLTPGADKKWQREISFLNRKFVEPDKEQPLFNFYNIETSLPVFATNSTNKSFFNGNAVTDQSYDWTQRFFSDGATPPDLEIFKVEKEDGVPYYYHRYNIAEELRFSDGDDKDDEKVSSLIKFNKEKIVPFSFDALIDEKLTTSTADSFLKRSWYKWYSGDEDTPKGNNLFFLGMIADDPGSFPSVEARRKQIAANFIDYYDKTENVGNDADKPTSDSDDWWNIGPTYTGNEKTYYINELGLVSKINVTASGRSFNISVAPTLLAEIIGIYKGLDSDGYKLSTAIETISFDISGEVTKTKDANGVEIASNISFGGDGSPLTASVNFSPDPNVKLEVEFKNPANGYMTGSKSKDAVSTSVEISSVPTDQTISEYTLDIKNIKIKFKDRAVLSKNGKDVDFSHLPETEQSVSQTESLTFKPDSVENFVVIGNMSVVDPRQNLYVRVDANNGNTTSDWMFKPTVMQVGKGEYSGGRELSMSFSISDSGAVENLSGSVNNHSNPKEPQKVVFEAGVQTIKSIDKGNCDLETVTDPAYTDSSSLSTAFIRDGAMKSMWELGLIHRGAAWETINLQSTALTPAQMYGYLNNPTSFAGINYADGDAAILDTVKLTRYAVNWGMIDINMLKTTSCGYDYTGSGDDRKLFETVAESLEKHDYPDGDPGTGLITVEDCEGVYGNLPAKIESRSVIVNAFDQMFSGKEDIWKNDSLREQAIAKLMPFLKTEPPLVTVFHVDVVAQTIQDVGGVEVSKLKSDGTLSSSHNTTLGTFDAVTDGTGLLYLDDITGQVKLRATFDCNPYTGKIKLRHIKYLD